MHPRPPGTPEHRLRTANRDRGRCVFTVKIKESGHSHIMMVESSKGQENRRILSYKQMWSAEAHRVLAAVRKETFY